ncbi:MAG: hypothetical protein H7281_15245 [Bacteriovorax sp.]|nr:hypothetical protein [Bacteriovorax sp.]
MDDKKEGIKALEFMKQISKGEVLKKGFLNLKNCKAKTGLKKVGRSRNQKGHKNY